MVVGRQAFPIGKVTFQGRTVKLREGKLPVLGCVLSFARYFDIRGLGLNEHRVLFGALGVL